MLKLIAEKCTNILIRNQIIQETRRSIYIYGFELLISTTLCILCIILSGLFFNYIDLAITFLLFFIPVRITAGGYHAKTYKKCFFLTNFIALSVISSACYLSKINVFVIRLEINIITFISIIYIWENAPVVSGKKLLKKEQIKKNRHSAHIIVIIQSLILLLVNNCENNRVSYTAMVTTIAVAIMMNMYRKEQKE